MLEPLITSKTRIKLLLKFFLNSNATSYLRGLEGEFDESTNAIRVELNRFEKAGLLKTSRSGNKKIYRANTEHPLYEDINKIIIKYTGLDHIIHKVVKELGDIEKVYVTGDIAKGKDTNIIDLIFVGKKIDSTYLLRLIQKAEKLIEKKIRFLIYEDTELSNVQKINGTAGTLLLWQR